MSEHEEENINNNNFQAENSPNANSNAPVKKRKKNKLKKQKTDKKKKKKGIQIGIGSITLILFCSFLIVIATFLQINITHLYIPVKLFIGEPVTGQDFLYSIKYIPQIPIVLFIVGLLGRRLGFVSILIYIIAGLLLVPIFALGGGWRYIFEYSFGYILAYLPAAFLTGTVLKKDYTYKNVAKAVFIGVITIHLIGVFYMTCIALVKHAGIDFVTGWIVAQSGIKIIYDFIFAYLLVLFAKYARIILWFYL